MRRTLLPALALLLLTAAAFFGVTGNGFISFDDRMYITQNEEIREGLTLHGIRWAATSFDAANWHPLTWLSHMADIELFGLDPRWHHAVGLLLHAANVLLLFLLLRRVTGDGPKSLFVAALFAVHPLHVESVAWASERKDLLSTLLVFPLLFAYLAHAARPTPGRAALLPVLLFAALAAKPMPVSVPLLLLALDWWPLGRVAGGPPPAIAGAAWARPIPFPLLVAEKVPMLVVAAGSAALTWFAQASSGAVSDLAGFPLPVRLGNAVLSYAAYLGHAAWPTTTSIFYPHPGRNLPPVALAAAVVLVAGISVAAWRLRRRLPWLATGWAWYLVYLLPVIGLVQAGLQSRADRYTYFSLTGVFIAVTWGISRLAAGVRLPRPVLPAAGCLVAATLALITAGEVRHWRNDDSLFANAMAVTTDNWQAHYVLAEVEYRRGETASAIGHLREAIRIYPNYDDAHYFLGQILLREGATTEAIGHLALAVRLRPDNAERYRIGGFFTSRSLPPTPPPAADPEASRRHGDRGIALLRQGAGEAATAELETALRLDPGNVVARYNLAYLLVGRGEVEGAKRHLEEVLRVRPGFAEAHNTLGVLLARQGRTGEAAEQFRQALRIRPDFEDARANLDRATGTTEGGR